MSKLSDRQAAPAGCRLVPIAELVAADREFDALVEALIEIVEMCLGEPAHHPHPAEIAAVAQEALDGDRRIV